MTEAPDVSDLKLDIRFAGRDDECWYFEVDYPGDPARRWRYGVPIWAQNGEDDVAWGYTEAYRAAENYFISKIVGFG